MYILIGCCRKWTGDQTELCSGDELVPGIDEPAAIGAEFGRIERELLDLGLVGRCDQNTLVHGTLVTPG